MMKQVFLTGTFVIITMAGMAQGGLNRDEAVYKTTTAGFYQDSIVPSMHPMNGPATQPASYLSVDFTGRDYPTNPPDYKQVWHKQPLSQGATGTCWCFAAISQLESEVKRLSNVEVKLSEMYVVYWEYVARAEYFVDHRGDMTLGEGSETNAILRIMKQHGLVPAAAYTGMVRGQKFHNHSAMFNEISSYLDQVKATGAWNKEVVTGTVKDILNHYMETPPASFVYKGQQYTPQSYLADFLKLNPNDYYCFMSTRKYPYHQKGVLEVADNWWKSDAYYNIPLNEFTSLMADALEAGFSVSVCGDVSEPGYDRYEEVGIIPDFDIPGNYINADARELRFNNKTTTDDHCLHVVGLYQDGNERWYMIKDSGAGGFDGPNKGYRFIHNDYVKLKILSVMIHKAGARKVLDKIIK